MLKQAPGKTFEEVRDFFSSLPQDQQPIIKHVSENDPSKEEDKDVILFGTEEELKDLPDVPKLDMSTTPNPDPETVDTDSTEGPQSVPDIGKVRSFTDRGWKAGKVIS